MFAADGSLLKANCDWEDLSLVGRLYDFFRSGEQILPKLHRG